MSLDTGAIMTNLINQLSANTTTLVSSLTSSDRIRFIKEGDAEMVPTQINMYPGIMIKLARESEEFSQLGQRSTGNSKHDYQLEFVIVTLISSSRGNPTAVADSRIFTKNTKEVLKNNITLSNTALWSLPETVDYFQMDLTGIHVKASIISFRTHHLSI